MPVTMPQWAMRMKACLNGGRPVPATAADLAVAAAGAVAAGADALHVHPRDRGGAESLLAEDVGAAGAAIRAGCPRVPGGGSTGLWVTGGGAPPRAAPVPGWGGPAGRPRLPPGDVHG